MLDHLARGERVPLIARRLDISPHTVRSHLKALFRKLGVRSQAQLIEHYGAAVTAGQSDARTHHTADRWRLSRDMLLAPRTTVGGIYHALLSERERHHTWCDVADHIATLLSQLGNSDDGLAAVTNDHPIWLRLERALARCCELMPTISNRDTWLFLTPYGDHHTFGLSLFELCVRELGHRVIWPRVALDDDMVERLIKVGSVTQVAASASAYSVDELSLRCYAGWLSAVCEAHRCGLVLGGSGVWPGELPFGRRLRSFVEWSEQWNATGRDRPTARD